MPDKRKIRQDVKKAQDNLERTRLPALNKMMNDKKAKLSQADDAIEKKAIKSEIDYIKARIKAAKAGVVVKEDDKEKNEEASAAITTTSVGNAAVAGGQANYAPHMGTFSRTGGYKKPLTKHKKKEKKKANEGFVKFYFEDKE